MAGTEQGTDLRSLPRDLYDVVEIYKRKDLLSTPTELKRVLTKKCEFKGVELPDKGIHLVVPEEFGQHDALEGLYVQDGEGLAVG